MFFFPFRIQLRIGPFAIVSYHFIRKVFHLKKPFNMHSCASHTLSIICTCNTTFKIAGKSIRFLKVSALKFQDMPYLIVIHPIQSVRTSNVWNVQLHAINHSIVVKCIESYCFSFIIYCLLFNLVCHCYRARAGWIRRSCRSEWNYFQ